METQMLYMEEMAATMAAMAEDTERTHKGLLAVLASIAESLQALADAQTKEPPNLQRRLEEYASFDWSSIAAAVLEQDQDGPTVVEWRGQRFTRRAPQNKYGLAIWYSRAIGKDEDGGVHYARLVTFKDQAEAERIPAKARTALQPAPAANGQTSQRPRGQAVDARDAVAQVVESVQAAQEAELAQAFDELPSHDLSAYEPAQPQPPAVDQDILDEIAALEADRRDKFPGVASPDQYGLWLDLVVPLLADQGGAAALEVTARLAGAPLRTVQQPSWRPAASLCAAWLAWLVTVDKSGQPIRPYRARQDRIGSLLRVLEAARTF